MKSFRLMKSFKVKVNQDQLGISITYHFVFITNVLKNFRREMSFKRS
jgi:hypothetical protein